MEHGHLPPGGDLADKDHVVLDDDDRVPTSEREEQFARLMCLHVGHARGGFVHEEQPGALREQHADLQPLLLPVGQRAGFPVPLRGEVDRTEDFIDAIPLGVVRFVKKARPNSAAAFEAEEQIFPNSVIGIDGRRLKCPTDTESVDFVFVHPRHVMGGVELDLARVRLGAAVDQVEESGLAPV